MGFKIIAANIALGSALVLTSVAAGASVSIFDTLGGPEHELDYSTSGVANVSANYTGPFGIETPDAVNGSVTGLSADFTVSGNGSGLLGIDYRVQNTSVSDSFNLGFLVRVDPDGGGFFTNDKGNSSFLSSAPGEAIGWEIDSSGGDINANIKPGGSLDNSNGCAAPAGCDLIYALQWDLGLLGPGQIAIVSIGLSDDGQSISNNFLDALSVSDSATLRFSGAASVVPVPAALPLFLSALAGFGFFAKRRK